MDGAGEEGNRVVFDRKDVHWFCMKRIGLEYFMFFNHGLGKQNNVIPYNVGLAKSPDGIHFGTVRDFVLSPSPGRWDGTLVEAHSILRVGDKWRMYYCGNNMLMLESWKCGFAESTNLIDWKKHPEPILHAGPEEWNEHYCADPYVIKFGGKYLMYFQGSSYKKRSEKYDGLVWNTGLAESDDGTSFSKLERPIIEGGGVSGVIPAGDRLIAAVNWDRDCNTSLMESYDGYNWKEVAKFLIKTSHHTEPILIDHDLYVYYTYVPNKYPNPPMTVGRLLINKDYV